MKRLIWADSLKGILIVLVVLGHAIQEVLNTGCFHNQLWNLIYSFHMPAFMAVSGYLNYRPTALNNQETGGGKNRLSVCYRRFWQLLVPYLLWSLIQWLTYQHCDLEALPNIVLYPDTYFWFLWVLFFIAVFFNIGDWIAEKLKVKQEVIIMGFCLLFSIIMVVANIRVLGYQFFAYYFMFFSAGYYLHKYNKLLTSNNWILLLFTAIWVFMAWYWRMHELPPFLNEIPLPHELVQYAYRFLTALVAIYVLLSIGPKLLDGNRKKPFERIGQISLGIYTVHLLLMPLLVKALKVLVDDTSIIIALSFVITLPLSWLIVWLLGKWKITNKLLLGKI